MPFLVLPHVYDHDGHIMDLALHVPVSRRENRMVILVQTYFISVQVRHN